MDRNVNLRVVDGSKSSSLSARRAWIEILVGRRRSFFLLVALRKESVDRNIQQVNNAIGAGVALRKESVDRNTSRSNACLRCWASLSARRAWIEISAPTGPRLFSGVALRKESVDRNTGTISDYLRANRSLSARRAWIEIFGADAAPARRMGRSPQGERG